MNELTIWQRIWRFIWPVLLIVALIVVGAGGSFLFFGEFSMRDFSNRLTYGGIGAVVVGGIAVVSVFGSYSTLGTPSVFTAMSDAQIAHERVGEHMRTNDKRRIFIWRMLIAGALTIGVGVLVDVLTR